MLIPREKTAACNSVKLTIDKNNFYILQVSFDDVMGNSTTLKFSNIFVNTGLAQKIFQFKPPAGVEVLKCRKIMEVLFVKRILIVKIRR